MTYIMKHSACRPPIARKKRGSSFDAPVNNMVATFINWAAMAAPFLIGMFYTPKIKFIDHAKRDDLLRFEELCQRNITSKTPAPISAVDRVFGKIFGKKTTVTLRD